MQWHKPHSHQAPFSKLKSGSTNVPVYSYVVTVTSASRLMWQHICENNGEICSCKGNPPKKISLQKMESLSGLNTLSGIFLAHVTQYYKSYKQN